MLLCPGNAIATNKNVSTDKIALPDIEDRRFTSGVQNILLKDGPLEVRLETKRSIKKQHEETGARNTRMHILDKYFVHPEILKTTPSDTNGSDKGGETLALLLEGPKPRTEGKDFGNRKLQEESPDVKKYGATSMEGAKIVNAASLLENSVRSHDRRLTDSLKYPEQNTGNTPPSVSRHYIPTQSANVLQRATFKKGSHYKFVNSLIRPQLAGISDDLNDLDALRNRAKYINLKTLKNDFKSRELESGGRFNEGSASFEENTLKKLKHQSSTSEYNTKQETEPRYNTDDMFLLGTPDESSYFENVFMANPEPIHSKPALAIRPTIRRQRYRAKTALEEGEISNVVFGKFRGDSDTTASGLDGFVHSEDESDSEESGLGPDARFNAALSLATQSETKINKAMSGVSLLSFKDKAMSHIEEESNDMYNERKEDSDARYSNGNNSVEAQRANPSLYFNPTKMRDLPKPTTLSSYKRTTIPHRKFSTQSMYQSTSSGSGEGTGSGEYYVPPHKSHDKQKHAHRITKVSLSAKKKTHAGNISLLYPFHKHSAKCLRSFPPFSLLFTLQSITVGLFFTGIFGAQDKATIKKCERMGKAGN